MSSQGSETFQIDGFPSSVDTPMEATAVLDKTQNAPVAPDCAPDNVPNTLSITEPSIQALSTHESTSISQTIDVEMSSSSTNEPQHVVPAAISPEPQAPVDITTDAPPQISTTTTTTTPTLDIQPPPAPSPSSPPQSPAIPPPPPAPLPSQNEFSLVDKEIHPSHTHFENANDAVVAVTENPTPISAIPANEYETVAPPPPPPPPASPPVVPSLVLTDVDQQRSSSPQPPQPTSDEMAVTTKPLTSDDESKSNSGDMSVSVSVKETGDQSPSHVAMEVSVGQSYNETTTVAVVLHAEDFSSLSTPTNSVSLSLSEPTTSASTSAATETTERNKEQTKSTEISSVAAVDIAPNNELHNESAKSVPTAGGSGGGVSSTVAPVAASTSVAPPKSSAKSSSSKSGKLEMDSESGDDSGESDESSSSSESDDDEEDSSSDGEKPLLPESIRKPWRDACVRLFREEKKALTVLEISRKVKRRFGKTLPDISRTHTSDSTQFIREQLIAPDQILATTDSNLFIVLDETEQLVVLKDLFTDGGAGGLGDQSIPMDTTSAVTPIGGGSSGGAAVVAALSGDSALPMRKRRGRPPSSAKRLSQQQQQATGTQPTKESKPGRPAQPKPAATAPSNKPKAATTTTTPTAQHPSTKSEKTVSSSDSESSSDSASSSEEEQKKRKGGGAGEGEESSTTSSSGSGSSSGDSDGSPSTGDEKQKSGGGGKDSTSQKDSASTEKKRKRRQKVPGQVSWYEAAKLLIFAHLRKMRERFAQQQQPGGVKPPWASGVKMTIGDIANTVLSKGMVFTRAIHPVTSLQRAVYLEMERDPSGSTLYQKEGCVWLREKALEEVLSHPPDFLPSTFGVSSKLVTALMDDVPPFQSSSATSSAVKSVNSNSSESTTKSAKARANEHQKQQRPRANPTSTQPKPPSASGGPRTDSESSDHGETGGGARGRPSKRMSISSSSSGSSSDSSSSSGSTSSSTSPSPPPPPPPPSNESKKRKRANNRTVGSDGGSGSSPERKKGPSTVAVKQELPSIKPAATTMGATTTPTTTIPIPRVPMINSTPKPTTPVGTAPQPPTSQKTNSAARATPPPPLPPSSSQPRQNQSGKVRPSTPPKTQGPQKPSKSGPSENQPNKAVESTPVAKTKSQPPKTPAATPKDSSGGLFSSIKSVITPAKTPTSQQPPSTTPQSKQPISPLPSTPATPAALLKTESTESKAPAAAPSQQEEHIVMVKVEIPPPTSVLFPTPAAPSTPSVSTAAAKTPTNNNATPSSSAVKKKGVVIESSSSSGGESDRQEHTAMVIVEAEKSSKHGSASSNTSGESDGSEAEGETKQKTSTSTAGGSARNSTGSNSDGLSWKDACLRLLTEKPRVWELRRAAERILKYGWVHSASTRPAESVKQVLLRDARRHGKTGPRATFAASADYQYFCLKSLLKVGGAASVEALLQKQKKEKAKKSGGGGGKKTSRAVSSSDSSSSDSGANRSDSSSENEPLTARKAAAVTPTVTTPSPPTTTLTSQTPSKPAGKKESPTRVDQTPSAKQPPSTPAPPPPPASAKKGTPGQRKRGTGSGSKVSASLSTSSEDETVSTPAPAKRGSQDNTTSALDSTEDHSKKAAAGTSKPETAQTQTPAADGRKQRKRKGAPSATATTASSPTSPPTSTSNNNQPSVKEEGGEGSTPAPSRKKQKAGSAATSATPSKKTIPVPSASATAAAVTTTTSATPTDALPLKKRTLTPKTEGTDKKFSPDRAPSSSSSGTQKTVSPSPAASQTNAEKPGGSGKPFSQPQTQPQPQPTPPPSRESVLFKKFKFMAVERTHTPCAPPLPSFALSPCEPWLPLQPPSSTSSSSRRGGANKQNKARAKVRIRPDPQSQSNDGGSNGNENMDTQQPQTNQQEPKQVQENGGELLLTSNGNSMDGVSNTQDSSSALISASSEQNPQLQQQTLEDYLRCASCHVPFDPSLFTDMPSQPMLCTHCHHLHMQQQQQGGGQSGYADMGGDPNMNPDGTFVGMQPTDNNAALLPSMSEMCAEGTVGMWDGVDGMNVDPSQMGFMHSDPMGLSSVPPPPGAMACQSCGEAAAFTKGPLSKRDVCKRCYGFEYRARTNKKGSRGDGMSPTPPPLPSVDDPNLLPPVSSLSLPPTSLQPPPQTGNVKRSGGRGSSTPIPPISVSQPSGGSNRWGADPSSVSPLTTAPPGWGAPEDYWSAADGSVAATSVSPMYMEDPASFEGRQQAQRRKDRRGKRQDVTRDDLSALLLQEEQAYSTAKQQQQTLVGGNGNLHVTPIPPVAFVPSPMHHS